MPTPLDEQMTPLCCMKQLPDFASLGAAAIEHTLSSGFGWVNKYTTFLPSCSERVRMSPLEEALFLMRQALECIDQCGDPFVAGPHLDLAIARLVEGLAGLESEDYPRPVPRTIQ